MFTPPFMSVCCKCSHHLLWSQIQIFALNIMQSRMKGNLKIRKYSEFSYVFWPNSREVWLIICSKKKHHGNYKQLSWSSVEGSRVQRGFCYFEHGAAHRSPVRQCKQQLAVTPVILGSRVYKHRLCSFWSFHPSKHLGCITTIKKTCTRGGHLHRDQTLPAGEERIKTSEIRENVTQKDTMSFQ